MSSSSTPPTIPASSSTVSAKVVYPYDAKLDSDLALSVGDHITNIEWPQPGEVWAQGMCGGRKGLFHPKCVQSYDQTAERLAQLTELSRGQGEPTKAFRASHKCKDYSFKVQPEDWYVCSICMNLSEVPTQTNCCGHTFCKNCISNWIAQGGKCPQCRTKGFSANPDVRTERFILNLALYCPNYPSGCNWEGRLRDVDGHLAKDCAHATIACTNGCGVSMPRFALNRHGETECPLRKISCPFCDHAMGSPPLITYQMMTTSHYAECPYWPMRCPNDCDTEPNLCRRSLRQHLEEDCPKQEIACDFVDFGCIARTLREDMTDHLKSDVHLHLTMVAVSYRKLRKEFDKCERKQKW